MYALGTCTFIYYISIVSFYNLSTVSLYVLCSICIMINAGFSGCRRERDGSGD
jgi:hypothetical protein